VLLPAMGKRRRHVLFLSAVSGTYSGVACCILVQHGGRDRRSDCRSRGQRLHRTANTGRTHQRHADEGVARCSAKWVASPVFGYGWLHNSDRWALVQSAYLQVLVETGIVGFIPLLVFLFAQLAQDS
jgi:hypothetical protein